MILNTATLSALAFTIIGLEALVLTQDKSTRVQLGQNVKILCAPSDFSSGRSDWALTWYQQKDGSPKFLLVDSTRASGLPSRFTYSGSGRQEYLNINGVTAEDEATYYCACHGCQSSGDYTTYFGGGTKLTVTNARPQSPPGVVLLAPSQDLSSGDRAAVVCLAQGFYPDGATLTWSEDGKAVAGTEFQTGESQRQSDGTFSLSSVLTVQPERWRSGHTYTCQLSHSALSSPLSKSVAHGQCS
ncbi:immunoglobulin lambda-1 light chain-like [Sardina pilchardus]|uniref:immunoglobulin lambda-1 light chain-like n=1 Tax=Sardina pilchardus TaxID=27697 RepID=UPI002E128C2A